MISPVTSHSEVQEESHSIVQDPSHVYAEAARQTNIRIGGQADRQTSQERSCKVSEVENCRFIGADRFNWMAGHSEDEVRRPEIERRTRHGERQTHSVRKRETDSQSV